MAGYCTLVLYFHSPAARENIRLHTHAISPSHPSNKIYVFRPVARIFRRGVTQVSDGIH